MKGVASSASVLVVMLFSFFCHTRFPWQGTSNQDNRKDKGEHLGVPKWEIPIKRFYLRYFGVRHQRGAPFISVISEGSFYGVAFYLRYFGVRRGVAAFYLRYFGVLLVLASLLSPLFRSYLQDEDAFYLRYFGESPIILEPFISVISEYAESNHAFYLRYFGDH